MKVYDVVEGDRDDVGTKEVEALIETYRLIFYYYLGVGDNPNGKTPNYGVST